MKEVFRPKMVKVLGFALAFGLTFMLLHPQQVLSKTKKRATPVLGAVEIDDPINKLPVRSRPINGAPAAPNWRDCGESAETGFVKGCSYKDQNGYVYTTDGVRIYSVSLSRPFLTNTTHLPYQLSVNMSCQQAAQRLSTSIQRNVQIAPNPATGFCYLGVEVGPSPRSGAERTMIVYFDSAGRMEQIVVQNSLPTD